MTAGPSAVDGCADPAGAAPMASTEHPLDRDGRCGISAHVSHAEIIAHDADELPASGEGQQIAVSLVHPYDHIDASQQ